MHKRGVTQVDWVVSLAIFLLYVAWFFIYINPSFMKDNTGEVLQSMVESKFKEQYQWNMSKMPLIIYSNITNQYEPIIADFNYNWNINYTYIKGDPDFIYDNRKIIFLGNINHGTNIFWILNSIERYNKTKEITDLNAYSTYATNSKNISVYFTDAFFTSMYFKDILRINSTKIYLNNELMNTTGTYTDGDFVAIYRINSDVFNHTTYVFAENPRVYNYFNFNTQESYTLKISADIHNYQNYYATNAYYGNKTSLPNCTSDEPYSFENNYINFYNTGSNPDTVTWIFNDTATIRLCYENNKIRANMSFTIRNETDYKIVFGEGDYQNITEKYYSYAYGLTQREKGLYLARINDMEYNELKSNWSYPTGRSFQIAVWNTSRATLSNRTSFLIKIIGPNKTDVEDATAKEWDDFILTKEGARYPVLINVKAW